MKKLIDTLFPRKFKVRIIIEDIGFDYHIQYTYHRFFPSWHTMVYYQKTMFWYEKKYEFEYTEAIRKAKELKSYADVLQTQKENSELAAIWDRESKEFRKRVAPVDVKVINE